MENMRKVTVEVKDVMAERWKVAKALAQGDNMEWVSCMAEVWLARICLEYMEVHNNFG